MAARRSLARLVALALAATATTGCSTLLERVQPSGGSAAESRPSCDPISTQRCMLPFPDDYYTVADPTSATGRRIAFDAENLPANAAGVHIDPTAWSRNDGFSPGSALLIAMPGVDLRASHAAGLWDIGASLRADAPIVIVDTTTGARWPYWAELDAHTQPGQYRTIVVRPAKNYIEGHRYVVGVRHLVNAHGAEYPTGRAFRMYRDHGQGVEAERFERIFGTLTAKGVARDDLQLAWDFTVASAQNLAGRALAMRDDAFASLGTAAPHFTITSIVDNQRTDQLREIEGTVDVPLYLDHDGAPGASMVLDAHDVPVRQGTYTAPFTCYIPPPAANAPSRVALYGHGLLGSRSQAHSGLNRGLGARYNVSDCAVDFIGLADEDVPNAIASLMDLSNFHTIPDRLQQSFLNFLFLGRALMHPQGLTTDPAFQMNGHPLIDRNSLYYDGNSQGAIAGGPIMALAQDFTRGVLGEAGMNYSTLLHRSVDFDEFQLVLDPSYPSEHDQLLALTLIQMLWDRGETNGYAAHINHDPYPNTPAKTVLVLGSVGDHQVSEWALQVQIRTMGIPGHTPYTAADRTRAHSEHGWGIAPIPQYPWNGSSYWLWDTGSPLSPRDSVPARDGHDPHDDVPVIDAVEDLEAAFLHPNGAVPDVCNGGPCSGPPDL